MVIDSRAIAARRPVRRDPGRAGGRRPLRRPTRCAAGAWGVLATPAWARTLDGGAVLAADDPVAALGGAGPRLAAGARRAGDRRHRLRRQDVDEGPDRGADRAAADASPPHAPTSTRRSGCRSSCSPRPPGTEVLVLELAMRGFGQIAELTAICEPDVGVITNVGPVHLEQMGSLEGVARAKAELLVGMRDGGVAVVPGRRAAARPATCATRSRSSRFGPGGDVRFAADGSTRRCSPARSGSSSSCRSPPATTCTNTLAAVAAARAVGRDAARPRRRGLRRAARRARRAGPRRHRRQRLLQRQPAVDARRPGRPRHAGARRTTRRGARRHARARAGGGRAPPRDRRPRAGCGRRAC